MPARSKTKQEHPDHPHAFGLVLALGAAGLLAAVAAVATAIGSVHEGPVGSGHVVIAGLQFTYPTLNGAAGVVIALAALGSVVVSIAVRSSWRQRRAYLRFIARLGDAGSLDGHPAVKVIEDPRPQAFCAGYLRPAVYVSKRTLDLLDADELEAVLAHEHEHLRVRDPLRFALGRVLGQALFFIPVLRPLCDRYSDIAELRADDAAIRACAGDTGPLASALLAFESNSNPGVAGISPERVDSLLGHPARWELPVWLLTASLLAVSALGGLLWIASEVASAHATFNFPIVSSQPCLIMLTLVPPAGCGAMLALRHRGGRNVGRSTNAAISH